MSAGAKIFYLLLPSACLFLSSLRVGLSQPAGEGNGFGKDVVMAEEDESLELVELRRMLDSDEVQKIVWKVENGEPIQIEIDDLSSFRSDRNYITIQGQPKMKPENWRVFYWIGKESTDTDAGDTAAFTVLLDAIVHSTVNIYREPDGRESDTFKSVFQQGGIEGGLDETMASESKAHDKPGLVIPRMFLIKGKEEVRFKEVEPSLDYPKDANNCVVLNSKIVYVYCGCNATDPQRKVAKKLGNMIIGKKKAGTELMVIERTQKEWSDIADEERDMVVRFIDEFAEIPEAVKTKKLNLKSEEFRSAEVMSKIFERSVSMKDDDKDLTLIRIHEENNGVVRDSVVDQKPVPISSLNTDDCYVIDTREDVGLLVWMGRKSEIDEREESARKAELYLREKQYDHATRIYFVDEEAVLLPAEAHLGDFIHFMKQLNVSPADNFAMNIDASTSRTI